MGKRIFDFYKPIKVRISAAVSAFFSSFLIGLYFSAELTSIPSIATFILIKSSMVEIKLLYEAVFKLDLESDLSNSPELGQW